jgi:hypothetical protein
MSVGENVSNRTFAGMYYGEPCTSAGRRLRKRDVDAATKGLALN